MPFIVLPLGRIGIKCLVRVFLSLQLIWENVCVCINIFINEIMKNRFGIWCNELQQNLTSNDAKK